LTAITGCKYKKENKKMTNKNKITAGIDSGSLATKGVLLDQEGNILSYEIILTAGKSKQSGEIVYQRILDKAGLSKSDIDYVLTTGYGREIFSFSNKNITEITCHAAGIHFLFPEVNTILDIGGQDSKAIKIDANGQVLDFVMNDKCAAGTGRFLEVIAKALEVKLEDLGEISGKTTKKVPISSMCTVFAETEVISLVANETPIPDIVNGVHNAITDRTVILLNKVGVIEPVAMSGGVAHNAGIVAALEEKLGIKLKIAEEPQIVGALGAAVLGQKFLEKSK